MIKKSAVMLFVFFAVMVSGIVTQGGCTMDDNDFGIMVMREKVDKLTRGMTRGEVEQIIGEPTLNEGFGRYKPMYLFPDGENLKLDYIPDSNNTLILMSARNKDGIDLLSTEYTAKVAEFSVFVNDEKIVTSNPVVTIDSKTYIPIKEFETLLDVRVEWNEEEKIVKIITN